MKRFMASMPIDCSSSAIQSIGAAALGLLSKFLHATFTESLRGCRCDLVVNDAAHANARCQQAMLAGKLGFLWHRYDPFRYGLVA
jgi:hypothetical protein